MKSNAEHSKGDDFANWSEPVTDEFAATSDIDSYRLSEEQVAFFHEHGYVAGVRILTDDQIEALRQELTELTQPGHAGEEFWYEYNSNESTDPDRILFHALGAWRLRPGFHDLLWHPAFTGPASQLLGGSVRFWHDQLFCKPAHHGGVVAWHQDYSYWTRTQPMAHLTCWIGLDESTADNGCLQYVPGSHQWDLLPITGLAGDMNAIREVLTDDQWRRLNNPSPIELKAGECAFHHPLMIHGSFANETSTPRRATVINVVKDGVRSDSAEPLLERTDAINAGEPLGGKFYPLLYEAK
ncbi:MAG: phytanoyl-CoA dioxygenase family protein [Planctomycetaceae bacterium]|nr:phytanoyl-CoA dioxygenase family protein [Planctomycetaceae bacterium]